SGATTKDLTDHTPLIGSNRFRLLVTFCNGTPDKTQIQSAASGIIDVYPVLNGQVMIQASSSNICPETEVVFSITSITSHGGSSATYQWYNNEIPIAGETSNVLS